MVKINICLATYNGEEFLREQLDSIKNQTYTDWTCLIRDDWSTDSTRKIIEEYSQADARFIFINPEDKRNLGSPRSFFELVKFEKADFYLFSDQDDVWQPDRLDTYLKYAQHHDPNRPLLVYSTWTSVDENLNVIKENNQSTVLQEQIAFNQINGMAIMMNHSLAEHWTQQPIGAHDSYLGTLAYAIGEVVYIPESTVLWRRQTKSESLNNYGRKYGVASFWQMITTSFKRANYIYQEQFEEMPPEKRRFFNNFISLAEANILKRAVLLVKLKLRRKSLVETVAMNVLLLTGYGKK